MCNVNMKHFQKKVKTDINKPAFDNRTLIVISFQNVRRKYITL